jgi:hypothetical protein
MINVTIRDSFPQVDEARIRAFERALGISLPHDYRQFLLRSNGGRPDPAEFAITGEPLNPSGTIHYFFGIHDGPNYNLGRKYAVYRERIPADLFPIAGDPGGNIICLAIRGDNVGSVYFWDHDYEALEGEVPDYSNVYFIADSFGSMLNNLW